MTVFEHIIQVLFAKDHSKIDMQPSFCYGQLYLDGKINKILLANQESISLQFRRKKLLRPDWLKRTVKVLNVLPCNSTIV